MTVAAARWGTLVAVGGATTLLALWARSLGVFSAGAAMTALRASGLPSSLDALGFDVPPLPVLLTVPVAAVPLLRWDPLAPVAVSALAAGAAAWWLFRSLHALGLGATAAALLALSATFHPAWLYAAASGSGSILAAALLLLGVRLFARWRQTGDPLAAAGSSFAVAFAGLARYDAFAVGLALASLIAFGPSTREDAGGRAALAIMYAAGVLGILGLWLVSSGVVTGDALAFIDRARVATLAPATPRPPVPALFVLGPAVALSALAVARRRASEAAVATLVTAGAALAASIAGGTILSLDAVVPLVPLGTLVLGELARDARAVAVVTGAMLVALGGLALAVSDDWGEGHRPIVDALRGAPRTMWTGERDLARAIRERPGRVLADPRSDPVPALLVASTGRLVDVGQVRVSAAAAPQVELVVVRTPTGRGAADRVATAWPTLYAGGTPWASFVASFPASGEAAQYRLYSVDAVTAP